MGLFPIAAASGITFFGTRKYKLTTRARSLVRGQGQSRGQEIQIPSGDHH